MAAIHLQESGSPPERQIIRDAIAEQLSSGDYRISLYALYSIRIHPCSDTLAGKSPFEIVNLPSFSIDCQEDGIVVVMTRATTTRILAILDYADPELLDKLAQTLAEIGVCLAVA